jgi:hypothetical protein
MTPYMEAKIVYEAHPPSDYYSFDEFAISWAKRHYLLSTPSVFALVKPVCHTDPVEKIWGLHPKPSGPPDTWLFYLFAGDLAEAWPSLPFLLDYAMWHRSKKGQTYLLPIDDFWLKFIDGKFKEGSDSASTSSPPGGGL